jgi:activator of HSP90 ATPase
MKLEQSGEMAYLLGKQMECEITTDCFGRQKSWHCDVGSVLGVKVSRQKKVISIFLCLKVDCKGRHFDDNVL